MFELKKHTPPEVPPRRPPTRSGKRFEGEQYELPLPPVKENGDLPFPTKQSFDIQCPRCGGIHPPPPCPR